MKRFIFAEMFYDFSFPNDHSFFFFPMTILSLHVRKLILIIVFFTQNMFHEGRDLEFVHCCFPTMYDSVGHVVGA